MLTAVVILGVLSLFASLAWHTSSTEMLITVSSSRPAPSAAVSRLAPAAEPAAAAATGKPRASQQAPQRELDLHGLRFERARKIAAWREKQLGRRSSKGPGVGAPAIGAAALAVTPHERRAVRAQVARPSLATSAAASKKMDLEDGVRLGSLCPDRTVATLHRAGAAGACPTADDIVAELEEVDAQPQVAPESPVCLFTSLTEAYVEGHLLFMRSALRHTPSLLSRLPLLYVLDQSLTVEARVRVNASYAATRWIAPGRGSRVSAKDVRTVTKFALNKEKTALFSLRAECGRVIKIDTGDMLVLRDLSTLLEMDPGRRVLATQALGQPATKLNGGLIIFGRFWLHERTRNALDERGERESRVRAAGLKHLDWHGACSADETLLGWKHQRCSTDETRIS